MAKMAENICAVHPNPFITGEPTLSDNGATQESQSENVEAKEEQEYLFWPYENKGSNSVVEAYKTFIITEVDDVGNTVDKMYCEGKVNKKDFRDFFAFLFSQMFLDIIHKGLLTDAHRVFMSSFAWHEVWVEWLPTLHNFFVCIGDNQRDLKLCSDMGLTFRVSECSY